MPKMGESVAEATITNWLFEIGDRIQIDDAVVEIATDKVDSDIPSEVEGVLVERLFKENDVVQVGQVVAVIETEQSEEKTSSIEEISPMVEEVEQVVEVAQQTVSTPMISVSKSDRFYSPLVKNIAKTENISQTELDAIEGTGKDGRVTKKDMMNFLSNRSNTSHILVQDISQPTTKKWPSSQHEEIIEMGRMEQLISTHMTESLKISAHVQSFIEVDVTKVWNWRNKVKDGFFRSEGEKITFTPIFMMLVAQALREFPMLNISVNGTQIIKKKNINLGMATALPDGNLIVPVIKNADQLSLLGITKAVNDLADRARNQKLNPDDVQDGTYTVTNVGAFGSLTGTPIINQPQVGILAIGAIRKVPAVIETSEGDFIGIRHKMMLSHSYDHRVVNGAQGGLFIKKLKDDIESWDEAIQL
jgi:2-oxoglutarate dehydrogenase E2 component (dihydrolipoamide succinyltransferase)